MPKIRRYAVTEKCQKVVDPWSRKNAKKSQVHGHEKMPKSRRSAVTEKCQKVAGHGKMPKSRRSAVMENCQKLVGPR